MANPSFAVPQIRSLGKYEEAFFSLVKVAEYLGWKISKLENGDIRISSGDTFPLLRLEMVKSGELMVMEVESEDTHGSVAVMQNPTKVEFEHFMRIREAEEDVRAVTIYNSLGCYVMLKHETTLLGGGDQPAISW